MLTRNKRVVNDLDDDMLRLDDICDSCFGGYCPKKWTPNFLFDFDLIGTTLSSGRSTLELGLCCFSASGTSALISHVLTMYHVNQITSSARRKRGFSYGMFKANAFPHLKST